MTEKKSENLQPDIITLITEGIQERKGRGITIVDLSDIEGAAVQGFVICQGTSPTQVSAIADSVRDYLLENAGIKPYNYDGYQNSRWIVIDYGHILVHIFLPEERERYNLEELWSDAKLTEVADLD